MPHELRLRSRLWLGRLWLTALCACVALVRGRELRAADEPAATIVVSAEPMSEAEERAPTSFVDVIDTSEFEGEFETLTGALAQAVGVQVRRFGGLGAFTTLSIRGSNPSQVRFYLDGIPLTTAGRDVVNLATLPLDSLQRIEVYRGTVPIGFGADGIAGVVNLVTLRPTEEPHTELAAYYGSFNTAKAVASHSQRVGGFEVLGNVTYLHTDGDFEFSDDNGTDFDPNDDTRVRRLNNALDSVEGLIKVRRQLDETFDLELTSDTYYLDQGVPARRANLALDSSYSDLRTLNYLRSHGNGLLDGKLDLVGSAYIVWEQSSFVDRKRELFGIGFDTDDTNTTAGANLLSTFFATDWNTASGFLELEYDGFQSDDNLQTPSPLPAQERLDFNLALQDEIGLFGDLVLIVPALRYAHLSDYISTDFDPDGTPIGPRERMGLDLFSPSIGAEIRPLSWFALKGNIGQYQRAPSFAELFGTRGFIHGNPDLDPETALNRDIGFVATPAKLGWLDEGRLEFSYFNNDVDDLIALVQTSQTSFTFKNFSSARAQGEEVLLHLSLLEHFTLDANYTHQETTNLEEQYFGNRLPLRPDDEVYARVEVHSTLGKIYTEFNYVDGNSITPSNFEVISSRDTYNVGFVANVRPWLAIGFEVDNITDNEVRDLLDFPLPGRSYIGSITARF